MLVGLGLLLGLSLWATSGVRDLVKDFLIADTTVLRWLGETLSVLVPAASALLVAAATRSSTTARA